jgi:hypothetical protein
VLLNVMLVQRLVLEKDRAEEDNGHQKEQNNGKGVRQYVAGEVEFHDKDLACKIARNVELVVGWLNPRPRQILDINSLETGHYPPCDKIFF